MNAKSHPRLKMMLICGAIAAAVGAGVTVAPQRAEAAPTASCMPIVSYALTGSPLSMTYDVRVTNTCSVWGPMWVGISCPGGGLMWVMSFTPYQTRTIYRLSLLERVAGCRGWANNA